MYARTDLLGHDLRANKPVEITGKAMEQILLEAIEGREARQRIGA